MTDGTRPVRESPAPVPAVPTARARVGDTVHDTVRDRVGVVIDQLGSYYLQLRPPGGGCEWDADPAHVRRLSQAELLSARVTDTNTRSRTGLDR